MSHRDSAHVHSDACARSVSLPLLSQLYGLCQTLPSRRTLKGDLMLPFDPIFFIKFRLLHWQSVSFASASPRPTPSFSPRSFSAQQLKETFLTDATRPRIPLRLNPRIFADAPPNESNNPLFGFPANITGVPVNGHNTVAVAAAVVVEVMGYTL